MSPVQILLTVLASLVVLVVALILFCVAGIEIVYEDGMQVILRIFGLKIHLVREKSKNAQLLKDCKNPEKEMKKLRKQQERLEKKQRKKQKRKERKAAKKAAKAQKKPMPKRGILDTVNLVTDLLKVLFTRTKGKFEIEIRKLLIVVASPNAAKTAILYGVAVQSVSYLLTFINSSFAKVIQTEDGVNVVSNFASDTPQAQIDILCSIPLRKLPGLALALYRVYRKSQKELLSKQKETSN